MLTLFRIVLVPVLVVALFARTPGWDWFAAITFGIAAITDYFDGYLARTSNSVTIYGKLMDPLADKFLVVSALIMLQFLDRLHPAIVILLICREMAITGLRALASAEGLVIAASNSAKWKTAMQMTGIPFIIVFEPYLGIPFFEIGTALIYISLFISLWSAQNYVVEVFSALRESRRVRAERRALKKQQKRERIQARRLARLAAESGKIKGTL